MKVTFKDLLIFSAAANIYLNRNKEQHPKTKVGLGIKKQFKKIQEFFDEYNSDMDDLKIKYCFTDKDGVIEYDIINNVQCYKFTPEKKIALKKAEKELLTLWHSKEVEIEPYVIYDFNTSDLTEEELDAFENIITFELN